MQRLPAINPGDTTKYPTGEGTFDVGAANEGSKILFYNESPLNIDLDFYNGSTDVLHAWEAQYWTLDADTKQIQWQIDPDSLNVSTPPVSAVFMTLFGPQERIGGTYPMALIRQASVGNVGGIATTNVAQVINDGNPLQEVLEATLSGHSSSDVIINNDGSFTFKGVGQIADITLQRAVDGSLNVIRLISALGIEWEIKDNAGNLLFASFIGNSYLNAPVGQQVHLQIAQADVLTAAQTLVHVFQALRVDGLLSALGSIRIVPQVASINGSTSGSFTIYEFCIGSAATDLKLCVCVSNNFRNGGGSVQSLALPSAFQSFARMWHGDISPATVSNGGVTQNVGTITGLPASNGASGAVSVGTVIAAYTLDDIGGGFDTIKFNSGQSTAHTGVSVWLGI